MDKPRFTLLLLEPGEIYFEDFSCSMTVSGKAPGRGRLKLCSKSLVYEPRGGVEPLIKMHFRDCIEISADQQSPSASAVINNVILVKVNQFTEMLADGVIAPYRFTYEEREFRFVLDFASADSCLILMRQLRRAATLTPAERHTMLATIAHSRCARRQLDPALLEDCGEEVRLLLGAERVAPLVRNPGKLALTPTALYFQPDNNIEAVPIFKMRLCELRRVFPRRFLLRQVGLEIYSSEECAVPHIYLVLDSVRERDELHEALLQSPNVRLERVHPDEMTLRWQNRHISNYDYLLYLNSLADRSKNDLTQYPVFPWVVSDYTSPTLSLDDARVYRDLSRPVGALSERRLQRLRERYQEMPEPKFLYGSHYSAPALVLFYLVRKYPHYMLCLQNGRFDHPDRMFNSLADAYNNCLNNMSDFKELVPEFYDTEGGGDFLRNAHGIEWGARWDGSRVGDVALPPWARSPAHLVRTLRAALESEHVSQRLHHWIDLVFGYKQRGEEAVRADNVFHYVCYEGAVELSAVSDASERHALEVQIMEFGQVPRQLFTSPHVRRVAGPGPPRALRAPAPPLRLDHTIRIHRERVTCVAAGGGGARVLSTGADGTLKVYCAVRRAQIRSVALCGVPLSCCVALDADTVAAASWDNHIYLYNVEFGRLMESFRAHDDSVNCLLWLDEERTLVSGGNDCVARAWVRPAGKGSEAGSCGSSLKGLRAELEHDGKVTCLAALSVGGGGGCAGEGGRRVACGTSDGEVYVWCVRSRRLLARVAPHAAAVAGLCRLARGDRLVSAGDDGYLRVTDLSVLASVYSKRLAAPARSLGCDGGSALWLGCADGRLLWWDTSAILQVSETDAHEGAVGSVCWQSPDTLLTAGDDSTIKVWTLAQDPPS